MDQQIFPCVIYKVQEGSPEYKQGFRLALHDIDDDKTLFINAERLDQHVINHGFQPISPDQMRNLRTRRAAK